MDGLSLLAASASHWLRKALADVPHVLMATNFHSMLHLGLLPRSGLLSLLVMRDTQHSYTTDKITLNIWWVVLVRNYCLWLICCKNILTAKLPNDSLTWHRIGFTSLEFYFWCLRCVCHAHTQKSPVCVSVLDSRDSSGRGWVGVPVPTKGRDLPVKLCCQHRHAGGPAS